MLILVMVAANKTTGVHGKVSCCGSLEESAVLPRLYSVALLRMNEMCGKALCCGYHEEQAGAVRQLRGPMQDREWACYYDCCELALNSYFL